MITDSVFIQWNFLYIETSLLKILWLKDEIYLSIYWKSPIMFYFIAEEKIFYRLNVTRKKINSINITLSFFIHSEAE